MKLTLEINDELQIFIAEVHMIWCSIHCSDISVDCGVGLSKEEREDCWQKSCVASFRVQRDRDRQIDRQRESVWVSVVDTA